ncbi:hypothetical protein [Nocardiopsis eucommiae]|uniref:hypothetical protein n=1 Tax=Nocardiopsis eucommiae TaxID=2831970 RepID=UPI003D76054E
METLRLRPESVADQHREARAWMLARAAEATSEAEYREYRDTDTTNVVNILLRHAGEVWPDAPEVAAEVAEDAAQLADYRAMFGLCVCRACDTQRHTVDGQDHNDRHAARL